MLDERDLPWLAEPLRALRDDSRGHALILHGGAGSGLLELALRAAQAWLCEQAPGPCGVCASCHLALAHSHTDLRVVMPETLQLALNWHSGDSDGGAGEGAGDGDGETKGKRKPSREIKVDAVRQAIAWAHTSSGRGRGKVLVIHPADAMNAVSANALLKTLEEPAPGMRLVLCVDDPERLLPTIRSRCQRMRLRPPTPEQACAWLAKQGVAEPEVLLRASGGQPLAALEAANQGMTASLWSGLPRQVAQGEAATLLAMPIPQALRTLQCLCHDAMAAASGAAPRYFPPGSVPVVHDGSALARWSGELTRSARHEDHPWHAGLLLDALLAQARLVLNSAAAAPARVAGNATNAMAASLGTLRP